MKDNKFFQTFKTAEQIINEFTASGKYNPLSDFETIEEKRFMACKQFMDELASAAEKLDVELQNLK